MTPEMERALRLSPRLRKALRERQAALLATVEKGDSGVVLGAVAEWAEAERAAEADLARKTAEPPRHRVSFLVEEGSYEEFCKTAIEHDLSPGEVARRYCISGVRFEGLLLSAVRRHGTIGEWVRIERRPNIAEIVLPDFSRR